MNVFRKNYLPNVQIFRCSQSGKFFAGDSGDTFPSRCLSKSKHGHYKFYLSSTPCYFETVDKCLEALYWYAYQKHLSNMHTEITYKKGIKV